MYNHPTLPGIHIELKKQQGEHKRHVCVLAWWNHRNWKANLLVQFSAYCIWKNQPVQYAITSTLLRIWNKYRECLKKKKKKDQIIPSVATWKSPNDV